MPGPHFTVTIFPLVTTIFWVWMLVDCLTSKRLRTGSKIGWGLFIFFTQFVGALIYFFVECRNRNPFEAASHYYRTIKTALGTSSFMPRQSPPPYAPRYEPPAPTFTPPRSRAYEEGYAATQYQPVQRQQAESAITPDQFAQSEQPQPVSEQTQYEEPMIQYPEMPM